MPTAASTGARQPGLVRPVLTSQQQQSYNTDEKPPVRRPSFKHRAQQRAQKPQFGQYSNIKLLRESFDRMISVDFRRPPNALVCYALLNCSMNQLKASPSGRVQLAEAMWQKMRERGDIKMESRLYEAFLSAYRANNEPCPTNAILREMEEDGVEPTTKLYQLFARLYALDGNLRAVRELSPMIPPDEYPHVMLTCLGRNRDVQGIIELLDERAHLREMGLRSHALNLAAAIPDVPLANLIIEKLNNEATRWNKQDLDKLLQVFLQTGNLPRIREILQMASPHFIQNPALEYDFIEAVFYGNEAKAQETLEQLRHQNIYPSEAGIVALFRAFAFRGDGHRAVWFARFLHKHKFFLRHSNQLHVMSALARSGLYQEAHEMLEFFTTLPLFFSDATFYHHIMMAIKNSNLNTQQTEEELTRVYELTKLHRIAASRSTFKQKASVWVESTPTRPANIQKVRECLDNMTSFKLSWDREAWNILLSVHANCVKSKDDLDEMYEVLQLMEDSGEHRGQRQYIALMTGHLGCGDLPSALELYEEAWADDNIPTSRSEMFVPIVDYLAKKGRVDEAFDNIHDLRSRGVQVDTDVYLPLFKHCQKTANTELCLRVLEDMHSLGVAPDHQVMSMVMTSFAAAGELDGLVHMLDVVDHAMLISHIPGQILENLSLSSNQNLNVPNLVAGLSKAKLDIVPAVWVKLFGMGKVDLGSVLGYCKAFGDADYTASTIAGLLLQGKMTESHLQEMLKFIAVSGSAELLSEIIRHCVQSVKSLSAVDLYRFAKDVTAVADVSEAEAIALTVQAMRHHLRSAKRIKVMSEYFDVLRKAGKLDHVRQVSLDMNYDELLKTPILTGQHSKLLFDWLGILVQAKIPLLLTSSGSPNQLVTACFKCAKEARQRGESILIAFQRMCKVDGVLKIPEVQHSLVKVCLDEGEYKSASTLLRMKSFCVPDPERLVADYVRVTGELEDGLDIMKSRIKRVPDIVQARLLWSYAMSEAPVAAMPLTLITRGKLAPGPEVLKICATAEVKHQLVLDHFLDNAQYDATPELAELLLERSSRRGLYGKVVEAKAMYDKTSLPMTAVAHYSLIAATAKQGKIQEARELLKKAKAEAVDFDGYALQTMIFAFCKYREGASVALSLVEEMRARNMFVPRKAMNTVAQNFAKAGDLETTLKIVGWVKESEEAPDMWTHVALARAYAEQGDVDNTRVWCTRALDEGATRIGYTHSSVYNSLLRAHAVRGDSTEAVELLRTIADKGLEVHADTLDSLFERKLDRQDTGDLISFFDWGLPGVLTSYINVLLKRDLTSEAVQFVIGQLGTTSAAVPKLLKRLAKDGDPDNVELIIQWLKKYNRKSQWLGLAHVMRLKAFAASEQFTPSDLKQRIVEATKDLEGTQSLAVAVNEIGTDKGWDVKPLRQELNLLTPAESKQAKREKKKAKRQRPGDEGRDHLRVEAPAYVPMSSSP